MGHGLLQIALRRKCQTKIAVCFRILGHKAKSLPVMCHGLLPSRLLAENITKVVVSVRIPRPKCEGLPITRRRVVQLTKGLEGDTKVGMVNSGSRVQCECHTNAGSGLLVAARLGGQHSEQVMRVSMPWVGLKDIVIEL